MARGSQLSLLFYRSKRWKSNPKPFLKGTNSKLTVQALFILPNSFVVVVVVVIVIVVVGSLLMFSERTLGGARVHGDACHSCY
jgi:hypothetical protein